MNQQESILNIFPSYKSCPRQPSLARPLLLTLVVLSSCTQPKKSNQTNKSNPPTQQPSRFANIIDSLERDLKAYNEKEVLPGFSVSLFTADEIIYQKAYGYADLEDKKPLTTKTLQGIASVSKTFVGVSVMKAIEEGKLTLDQEINSILPFKVEHPMHKDIPITIRHLATHTASISDDGNYDKAYIFSEDLNLEDFPESWEEHLQKYANNTDISLETYLNNVFDDDIWGTDENYLKEAPGTIYKYSNIGAALLGYCIQLAVGKDFKEYSKEVIFDPLGLENTSWIYNNDDFSNHVTYYNEIYNAVPEYYCATYPDGGLSTNIEELTKYLQSMMSGYQGGESILKPESFKTMMSNQIPDLDYPTGVIWDLEVGCCIGHSGNDFGTATMMYFSKETGIGKIFFTNISTETEEIIDTYMSIFNNLFKYDNEITEIL